MENNFSWIFLIFLDLFYQMSKESNQKITFNTEILSNNKDDKIIFSLLRHETYVNNLYMKKRIN